jgi:hypothetical protein
MRATRSSSLSGSIPCGWKSDLNKIWNSYRGHNFCQLVSILRLTARKCVVLYSGQQVLPSVQASTCDHDAVSQPRAPKTAALLLWGLQARQLRKRTCRAGMEKEKRATVAILQSHLVGKSHLIMRGHQSFGRLHDIRQHKSANEALRVVYGNFHRGPRWSD